MLRFLLILLAVAAITSAGMLDYTGTTAGGPIWNRPVAGNPPVAPASGVATDVPYHVQAFTVDLVGSYSFLSTGVNPVDWDNYTFLYSDSFTPASPFVNVVIGNDDNPGVGVSGFTANLLTGTNYFFITTGFSNSDEGSFSNSISGPGNITAGSGVSNTPEPSSILLLSSGLLLAAFRLRSKSSTLGRARAQQLE